MDNSIFIGQVKISSSLPVRVIKDLEYLLEKVFKSTSIDIGIDMHDKTIDQYAKQWEVIYEITGNASNLFEDCFNFIFASGLTKKQFRIFADLVLQYDDAIQIEIDELNMHRQILHHLITNIVGFRNADGEYVLRLNKLSDEDYDFTAKNLVELGFRNGIKAYTVPFTKTISQYVHNEDVHRLWHDKYNRHLIDMPFAFYHLAKRPSHDGYILQSEIDDPDTLLEELNQAEEVPEGK